MIVEVGLAKRGRVDRCSDTYMTAQQKSVPFKQTVCVWTHVYEEPVSCVVNLLMFFVMLDSFHNCPKIEMSTEKY